MSNTWIEKGQWQVKRLFERLDLFGKLAFLLVFIAIWAWFFMVMPQQSAITALQAQHLNEQDALPGNPALEEQNALSAFSQQFPTVKQRAAQVERLMHIAAMHHVKLDQVTYQNLHQAEDIFHHYFVEFTLNETYSNTYNFLSDVLHQMPFASIERLNMNRDAIKHAEITSKIKLGLHFTKNPTANSAETSAKTKVTP